MFRAAFLHSKALCISLVSRHLPAIRASIKKRKRNKRGELLFRVKITQVLFSGKVKVERSKVVTLLVISSQCTCLKLRKGREYLILGHENRETNRLMVSQLSITARWRDVFARRITVCLFICCCCFFFPSSLQFLFQNKFP